MENLTFEELLNTTNGRKFRKWQTFIRRISKEISRRDKPKS